MTFTDIEDAVRAWFVAVSELPDERVIIAEQSSPRPSGDDPFATVRIVNISPRNIDAVVPSTDGYQIRVDSFIASQAYTLKVNGGNYTFTTGVTVLAPAAVAAGVAAAITALGVTATSAGDIISVDGTDPDLNVSAFVVAGPMTITAGDGQDIVGDRVVSVSFQTFGVEASNVMTKVLDRHRAETFLAQLRAAGVTLFRFEPLTDANAILETEWDTRAIATGFFGVRSTFYDAVGTIEKVEIEATVNNDAGQPVLTETLTIGV